MPERTPLEKVIGDPMRQRYERELEQARLHHEHMMREVAEKLSLKHQILCIEAQVPGTPSAVQWGQLHPEQQQMYMEAQTGGEQTFCHAPIFRFMFGYEPGDERFAVWQASHGELKPPVDIEGIDAVLVTGSAANVTIMEEEPDSVQASWMRRVTEFLKATRRHEIPTLAVCFGHQIFAIHRGGKVGWMKDEKGNNMREFGPAQMMLTPEAQDDPLLAELGDDFWAQSSHSQEVLSADQQAIVLAHNPASRLQVLRYVEGLQWSMQNHPEITAIATDIILGFRAEAIQEELSRMTDEAKVRLGWETLDQLRERMLQQDTHEARTVLFSNFLTILAEQLNKKR